MIYGYCRCSTDKQTVEHQQHEILKFAEANDMVINSWVQETISSSQPLRKRALKKLLSRLRHGDILIACEISRLGRSLLDVMNILSLCLARECQVWTIKENYRLGNDIQSKVLAFAFGLAAEIERNLISQRTKASLDNIKARGIRLGRPLSEKSKYFRLMTNVAKIKQWQSEGVTQAQMALELGISRTMLRRIMQKFNLVKQHEPRPPRARRYRRLKRRKWAFHVKEEEIM
ncbi:MAG: recombinase family protein [Alphaproteobacteria bacterium]|nr:recombinase family protein [Alphaproteobacteria bacterium]